MPNNSVRFQLNRLSRIAGYRQTIIFKNVDKTPVYVCVCVCKYVCARGRLCMRMCGFVYEWFRAHSQTGALVRAHVRFDA